jgi:hypothetical protein
MSRLDAVVRVLKATGKALHYDVITRQALQQGIIRFTGSQGTAGESMKVSAQPAVLILIIVLSFFSPSTATLSTHATAFCVKRVADSGLWLHRALLAWAG